MDRAKIKYALVAGLLVLAMLLHVFAGDGSNPVIAFALILAAYWLVSARLQR